MLVIDIETKPQSIEKLKSIFIPKSKEEFVGAQRWRPDTIEAKYAEYLETAFEDFVCDAALNASTGEVCAIGYLKSGDVRIEVAKTPVPEAMLIARFWEAVKDSIWTGRHIVGHNLIGFDLPFLIRRSWILGVHVPDCVFTDRRYFNPLFQDTMQCWCFGRQGYASLDLVARALGVGRKPSDMKPADFARLIVGNEQEQQQAVDYLSNDLYLTHDIANRMRIGMVSA